MTAVFLSRIMDFRANASYLAHSQNRQTSVLLDAFGLFSNFPPFDFAELRTHVRLPDDRHLIGIGSRLERTWS